MCREELEQEVTVGIVLTMAGPVQRCSPECARCRYEDARTPDAAKATDTVIEKVIGTDCINVTSALRYVTLSVMCLCPLHRQSFVHDNGAALRDWGSQEVIEELKL